MIANGKNEGKEVDAYSHSGRRTDTLSLIEATELGASTWLQLRHLFSPLDKYISCLQVHPNMDGHKAIIRFTNHYGLEIAKFQHSDFFEMTVIRFREQGTSDYEFAFDISHIHDLTLCYTDKDIIKLCGQVSLLK